MDYRDEFEETINFLIVDSITEMDGKYGGRFYVRGDREYMEKYMEFLETKLRNQKKDILDRIEGKIKICLLLKIKREYRNELMSLNRDRDIQNQNKGVDKAIRWIKKILPEEIEYILKEERE